MKYPGTRLATGLAVIGLAWSLLASPLIASPVLAQSSKGSAACSAIRQRLADAPQIITRIEANLDRLNARLDNVRRPARRVSLEDRIERLEALRSDLAAKVADAHRACGTV